MRIITPEINRYFDSLYVRLDEAADVPFERVQGEWQPSPSCCHSNVEHWAAVNPNLNPVRGWFVEVANDQSGHRFIAHSVLSDSGRLFDITPIDCGSPRPKFLAHQGAEADFRAMQTTFSSVEYPIEMGMADWPAETCDGWT